jgi:hypothetical protein
MPGLPSKPDVTVNFTTENSGGGNSLQSVFVKYPDVKVDEQETATVSCNGQMGPRFDGMLHKFETTVPRGISCGDVQKQRASGAARWLTVKVCKQNFLGETCNSNTFDLSTQAVVPVKVTGAKSGASFANSLFVGAWSVTSTVGGAFNLEVVQLSGGNLFGEIDDGNATDKGTIRGSQTDSLHAQLTLKQPGLNRLGSILMTVSSDGNSFTATGTLASAQPITWQGTKKHPVTH